MWSSRRGNVRKVTLYLTALAIVAATSLMLVACNLLQKDSPSRDEVQVLKILYENLTGRERELYGPTPTFGIEHPRISWAFVRASFDATKEAVDDPSTPINVKATGRLDVQLAPDVKLNSLGLSRMAKYLGSGWWTVTIAHFGRWRVNENSFEVRPDDENARQVDGELSPSIAELKEVLEYGVAIGHARAAYPQIVTKATQMADIRGEGLVRDRALATLRVLDEVTQLKQTIQAIPVPRLAKTHSRLELKAFDSMELGLSKLATLYLEASPKEATKLAEAYSESLALINEAMLKWGEANHEEDRLLTYIEKRRNEVLPVR